MKNFKFLAVVLIMAVACIYATKKGGWSSGLDADGKALDTLTNSTGTTFSQPDSGYFNGSDGVFSVAFKFNKISGTPAGYAVVQQSADGYNWELMTRTSADSFLITNVDSAIHHWHYTGVKATNIRVVVTASGTQSTAARALFRTKTSGR